jgi:hypothetical protein
MILVVGLAAAVLAGIAAAFYFTVRPGSARRGLASRLGPAGPGRAAASRAAASRASASRAAASRASAARPGPPAGDGDTPAMARPRRRRGWRNGADVDEELWPAEGFGGISDEQFWDDLASDKPLATTARTAQSGPARGDAVRPPDGRQPGPGQPGPGQPGPGQPGPGRAAGTARPFPGTTQPVPAARSAAPATQPVTAVRPPATATQPVPALRAPVPATQPAPAARPPVTGTQPVPALRAPVPATQPVPAVRPTAAAAVRPAAAATQPAHAARPPAAAPQPAHAAGQPAEPGARRRGRRDAEEDPLTSAAFALRASGPVDGHSSLTARGTAELGRAEAAHRPGPAGAPGGTSPYPYPERPYREPAWDGGSSRTDSASANTPPYGESYGLGGTQPRADDPRRSGGHGRDETRERYGGAQAPYLDGGAQAPYLGGGGYPSDGSPRNGRPSNGYPANGYPATGYSENSYPGNSYPGPRDPWGDSRRLAGVP